MKVPGTLFIFGVIAVVALGFPDGALRAAQADGPAARPADGKPVFTLHPKPAIRTVGDSVTFSASATGAAEVRYQWQHDWKDIPGATNASLTIPHVRTNDYGQYGVVARINTGARRSDVVRLLGWERLGWGANADDQLQGPTAEAMSNVVALAAGPRHALALTDDGRVMQWGHAWGSVPVAASNLLAVAAGYSHSAALRKDGLVLTWGEVENPANRWLANSNLVGIAAGQFHNLGFTDGGRIVTWGTNGWGLLRPPANATGVVAVAAGARHSLALRADGKVVAWGDNSAGQTKVPAGLNDVVTIAGGQEFSLALEGNGRVVAWGRNDAGQCNVPANVTNAVAIAVGAAHAVALLADGSIVTWGDNSSGQLNVPAWAVPSRYHIPTKLIAAGGNFTLAQEFSINADYPIDLRRDALFIYNSNPISTNSAFIKDYYLAHRPRISGINVLGVNCTTNERISTDEFSRTIAASVKDWLNHNAARKPSYIIMSYDLPLRHLYDEHPGMAFAIANLFPGVKPSVFFLNMATVEATRAYIDKLEYFGTTWPSRDVVISASDHGYGNTNFVLDGIRHGANFGDVSYQMEWRVVSNAVTGVMSAGNPRLACFFRDGAETNWIVGPHITTATNVAGYMSWGVHSSLGMGYATNGFLKWRGNSGWWVIQTVESFNGVNRENDFQGNFVKWFSPNAFGGTNYSNTPVGAVGHVREPGLGGINDAQVYFGLWAQGKKFGTAAAASQRLSPESHIIFGDPFVRR